MRVLGYLYRPCYRFLAAWLLPCSARPSMQPPQPSRWRCGAGIRDPVYRRRAAMGAAGGAQRRYTGSRMPAPQRQRLGCGGCMDGRAEQGSSTAAQRAHQCTGACTAQPHLQLHRRAHQCYRRVVLRILGCLELHRRAHQDVPTHAPTAAPTRPPMCRRMAPTAASTDAAHSCSHGCANSSTYGCTDWHSDKYVDGSIRGPLQIHTS